MNLELGAAVKSKKSVKCLRTTESKKSSELSRMCSTGVGYVYVAFVIVVSFVLKMKEK